MNVTNTPFDFEFEFNGETITVSAAMLPPVSDEERGTFAYRSSHPTFIKIFNGSQVRKVYESLSSDIEPGTAGDRLLFTYKLCLASYRKFRNLRMTA